ncbi:MAG: UDP-N-acetylglucosamine diphosphorylase [Verrucomicrobiae bacterium]|nr:UDP-N-acetylglucosamine diphosphorylase [Verrucomicrobiae bacterium]
MITADSLFDLSHFAHREIFDGVRYPWEPLGRIADYLKKNLRPGLCNRALGHPYIEDNVFIGKGSVVEEGAMIKGPAIIGENCEIRHGAYIRGNVIVGDGCVIGNSTELKNSILLNEVEAPHYNYVGDSVLGNKAHLAAGVICSNLKLAAGNVVVEIGGQKVDTGLRKFGALVGDGAQVGCNSVLNPGSILGRGSILYPVTHWRGVLEAGRIVKTLPATQIVEKR